MEQQKPIILPPQVIAALYERVLIGNTDNRTEETAKRIDEKKVVVIAESTNTSFDADKKIFLDSIITACKLERSTVEVITDKHALALTYEKLQEEFNPKTVILFGASPSSILLPVVFPQFQIQSFQDTKYLCAPELDTIKNDKALKLQLWQCLKQLFP